MYDDGWVYSKPGKFKGGPATVGLKPPKLPESDMPANPAALHQRHQQDTFDNDKDTASMYDDGWVYSKPGKFKGGPATVGLKPPKLPESDMPANPAAFVQHHKHHHHQHNDSFDRDPTTASMYDDQHVYSKPGEGWA